MAKKIIKAVIEDDTEQIVPTQANPNETFKFYGNINYVDGDGKAKTRFGVIREKGTYANLVLLSDRVDFYTNNKKLCDLFGLAPEAVRKQGRSQNQTELFVKNMLIENDSMREDNEELRASNAALLASNTETNKKIAAMEKMLQQFMASQNKTTE